LLIVALGRRKIVFGGHPAITPMIVSICADLRVEVANCVVLYQSRFFEGQFPEEIACFKDVVYTESVPGDRKASLLRMRQAMLSRSNLNAAVFIGGMEGVLEEHQIFTRFHPNGIVLALSAPGGAAKRLANNTTALNTMEMEGVDFARLFYRGLGIDPKEGRNV